MTMLFSLAGCVDQSQGKKSSDSGTKTESSADTSSESAESLLKITDPKEKAAVEAAKKEGAGAGWRAEDHCDLSGNRRYL